LRYNARLEAAKMTQMTVHIPDDLAIKVQPLGAWLPTVIELGLVGFKTQAVAAATELTEFLSQNPPPQELLQYHASPQSQERLRRLLALNESGLLSTSEGRELDELQRLEHIVVMLKAQVAEQLRSQP
jgi:hypothetical protein